MPKSTRTPRQQWFGTVLPWTHTDDRVFVQHRGVTHDLIKVSRRWANDLGGGVAPGWHFNDHPDLAVDERGGPGTFRVGPGLGSTIGRAKTLAEVWLLVGPEERHGGDGVPNLTLVFADAGAPLVLSGERYVYPCVDYTALQISVHRDWRNPGQALGALVPVFTAEERALFMPVLGTGPGRRPLLRDPEPWAPWPVAAAALRDALAQLWSAPRRTD